MATFDVLLPVKNGLPYLHEALDSIVQQWFSDWRLLVLDHGSTDGSLELALQYSDADKRIEVYSCPEAKGLSGLLNFGLDMCDGSYVLRQDADDVSLPERMEVLARVFERDPTLAVVGSLGDVIDASGQRLGRTDMPVGPQGVAAGALFRTPISHPSAAFRLSAMHEMGARYGIDFIHAVPAQRRMTVSGLAEDYFLFGQMALVTRCVNVERDLFRYRWHGENVGARRFVEQMRLALSISRYLAESMAIFSNARAIDPAPFCNHGERLFDLPGQSDFRDEFNALSRMLVAWVPDGPELRRELAFRKLFTDRSRVAMAARFCEFAARYGTRPSERRTVKSWLLREIAHQPTLKLTASGLHI